MNRTRSKIRSKVNDSFSDLWGEFVDLSNGGDTAAERWLIGEDLSGGGGFRDMQEPPVFGDPDRLNSPLFVQPVSDPNSSNDWGGVHSNSGVNNKLCYLLTDGDTFNDGRSASATTFTGHAAQWRFSDVATSISLGPIPVPFRTVTQGYNAAYPGDRLLIRGGTYSETVVFEKHLEVIAWDGIVTIGQ